MDRKRRDELDEPTKIDADFEQAVEAMLGIEADNSDEEDDGGDDQGAEDA